MKPPPARSFTSVSLIGVPSNWKSSRSLASGSVGDRFGARGFDRPQPVDEYRGEDCDHLPIAIVGTGELAPYALHRCRQHPVLTWGGPGQGGLDSIAHK